MSEPINTPHLAQYNLGRDAHKHGYSVEDCPFSAITDKSAWWRAGWHDEDLEQGNRKYF